MYMSIVLIVQSVLNTFIVVGGTIGNLFIIILIMQKKKMRTVTNYYVFNLAIADLIIAVIIIPVSNIIVLGYWKPRGLFECTILMPVQEHLAGVCVLTHTALSLGRYYYVTHAFKGKALKPSYVLASIVFIWLIAFTIMSVGLMDLFGWFGPKDKVDCMLQYHSRTHRLCYRFMVFTLTYVIPMVCTGFSYSRIRRTLQENARNLHGHVSKESFLKRQQKSRRLDRTLTTMYVFFGVTTLPLQALYVIDDLKLIPVSIIARTIWFLFISLFYLQVVTNPLVLLYMGEEYRKELYKLSVCFCIKNPKIRKASSAISDSFRRYRSKKRTSSQNTTEDTSIGRNSIDYEKRKRACSKICFAPQTNEIDLGTKHIDYGRNGSNDFNGNNDAEKFDFNRNSDLQSMEKESETDLMAFKYKTYTRDCPITNTLLFQMDPCRYSSSNLYSSDSTDDIYPINASRPEGCTYVCEDIPRDCVSAYYDDGTLLFCYDPSTDSCDSCAGKETTL